MIIGFFLAGLFWLAYGFYIACLYFDLWPAWKDPLAAARREQEEMDEWYRNKDDLK